MWTPTFFDALVSVHILKSRDVRLVSRFRSHAPRLKTGNVWDVPVLSYLVLSYSVSSRDESASAIHRTWTPAFCFASSVGVHIFLHLLSWDGRDLAWWQAWAYSGIVLDPLKTFIARTARNQDRKHHRPLEPTFTWIVTVVFLPCASRTETGRSFGPPDAAAETVARNEKMLSPAVTSPCVPSS